MTVVLPNPFRLLNNYFEATIWSILLLLIGGFALAKILDLDQRKNAQQPNVLILLADDLGYNDVGAFGGKAARTPNIDSLAENGVRFTRHYADATCSPSRTSLLTGIPAERSGFRPNGAMIPDDFQTIAELLKASGYRTNAVGKWHAGEQFRAAWPRQKGFDTWFGFLNQWQLAKVVAHDHSEAVRPTYINPVLREANDKPGRHKGHLTDILVGRSIKLITEAASSTQPWFLYHAFYAPHTPIEPHQRYAELFEDTPAGRYQALVYQLDAAVGKLVETLKETNQLENTIVIFLSDNGGTNHELDNNFPFFGAKNELYEGSYRTPLVIGWPKRITGNRAVNETVMNFDILPTIAELTGSFPTNKIDGESLAQVLLDPKAGLLPNRSRLWEVYHWNMDAISASFLHGETNQRITSLFGLFDRWFDLNSDYTGNTNIAEDESQMFKMFKSYFWPEHHNLAVFAEADLGKLSGKYLLKKQAPQRTPGLGGFSLGIAVGPWDAQDSIQTTIAEQKGVWDLQLNSSGSISWRVAGVTLSSNRLNLSQCNEIILSGSAPSHPVSFHASQKQKSRLKLFVNGQLEGYKEYSKTFVTEEAINEPTIFYLDNGPQLGKFFLSNMVTSSSKEIYNPKISHEGIRLAIKNDRRNETLLFPNINELNRPLCNSSSAL